jgi:hypothetical protein
MPLLQIFWILIALAIFAFSVYTLATTSNTSYQFMSGMGILVSLIIGSLCFMKHDNQK